MAYHSITMSQIKQVIKLKQLGHGSKKIADITSLSRNTVKEYLRRFEKLSMDVEQALQMENPELEELFKGCASQQGEHYALFLQRAEYYVDQLTNQRHISRQILWEEDTKAGLIRYGYSQFCFHLQQYIRSKQVSMVMHHEPGDKVYVDFAGDKLYLTDPDSGKLTPCEVLLLTLGYSSYTVAIALPSQRTECLIEGIVEGLNRIGGIPQAIVPDNLKSAVIKAHRYDPQFNEAFLSMANHYQMTILPARVRKPRDKPKVETAVNVVYNQVYARIRNFTFTHIHQLNETLKDQLNDLNNRVMQQYGVSRNVLLERDERSRLRPLPQTAYQPADQLVLTVQQNAHVYIGKRKQYYSVPHRLVGEKVKVILSSAMARVYHQGQCIATHALTENTLYVTQEDHMASRHIEYLKNQSANRLKERARYIGESVEKVLDEILQSRRHPEHSYKTCEGVLALARKYDKEKLRKACVHALEYRIFTLKYITRLVHSPYADDQGSLIPLGPLPEHKNIRGANTYQ